MRLLRVVPFKPLKPLGSQGWGVFFFGDAMFWVPVIFLCTMQGDCAFMYDDGQTTKAQCEKMLSATLKRIKNDTNFRLSDGVCLDISAPKI